MINLTALQVFLTVAECGSFSDAARHLNLTQPSISQTIRSLERQFGIELFQRQGRSIRLTSSGQMLAAMGRELLVNSNRVEEMMHSLQGEVIGDINIGCSTAAGKYLLPPIVARFRNQYNHVRVNVNLYSRPRVMQMLLDGQIPIGVSSKRIDHAEIEYKHFCTDEVILIAPADHRWARFPRIRPEDVLEEPLIMREEGSGTTEVLMEGFHAHDISPDMLNVVMILGNAEAISMAVEEGIGVAFSSRLAAARSLLLERVVEVEVEGMSLERKILLARNRRFPATRAQAVFWDFVSQAPAWKNELSPLFTGKI